MEETLGVLKGDRSLVSSSTTSTFVVIPIVADWLILEHHDSLRVLKDILRVTLGGLTRLTLLSDRL